MKLTTTMQVSVDGVMQGPGAREDELDTFERHGWAHFDNEAGKIMDGIFQRADAFLFGRLTYKHFAATWGRLGRSERQPDPDSIAHEAQVCSIKDTHRPALGEYDCSLG